MGRRLRKVGETVARERRGKKNVGFLSFTRFQKFADCFCGLYLFLYLDLDRFIDHVWIGLKNTHVTDFNFFFLQANEIMIVGG